LITNDKISPTTVSFVSGRGGVGKSVISLSLSKFLGSLGNRVLLIDFDLSTYGASHFFKDEIENEGNNKESQSKKGIVELLELLKECKIQQQRIVKLLDELADDNGDQIQQQKEEIVKLLEELVNHRMDRYKWMRELIIESLGILVVSKQESKKDEIEQQKKKIIELLDKLISGKVKKLVQSSLLFIVPSFKITEPSLENLKSEYVPYDVLEKLQSIKNQEFTGEEKFWDTLRITIGDEQAVRLKSLILKHSLIGNPKFDFIPSTIFSAENSLDYGNLPGYSLYFHLLINSIVELGQKYDFILLDSQAGANPCSYSVVKKSHKVVFVVHPDPLCVGATYSLDATFKDILPDKKNIFCLYNFLQKEEAKTYSVIEFPRFIDLPPLPYDDDVYMSLKLGKIPFDGNNPTPFSLGIIRLAKSLLDVGLEEYKDDVEKKLEEINSTLKSFWKKQNIIKESLFVIFAALICGFSSAFILMGKFSNFFNSLLIMVVIIFCLFIIIRFLRDIITDIRGSYAIQEETIFYLKAEQRKYETLKLTMKVFDMQRYEDNRVYFT